jgi:hypothetical protein
MPRIVKNNAKRIFPKSTSPGMAKLIPVDKQLLVKFIPLSPMAHKSSCGFLA